jgi:phosphinothricin acetyltransferase
MKDGRVDEFGMLRENAREAGQLALRRVADADLPAVAGIFAHYVVHSLATFDEDPPTAAAWERKREEISARGLPFLVAEAGGHVAGYAYASVWRDKPGYRHTAEDTVYVAPGSTGQGLGRLLLRAVIDECAAIGLRQLVGVIADTGDPASQALHRACGFREAGRLRSVGYKHERWIDTVLMQLDLQP